MTSVLGGGVLRGSWAACLLGWRGNAGEMSATFFWRDA